MMRIEKDVALIDNPLLRAAIWGDQSCLYKRNLLDMFKRV